MTEQKELTYIEKLRARELKDVKIKANSLETGDNKDVIDNDSENSPKLESLQEL